MVLKVKLKFTNGILARVPEKVDGLQTSVAKLQELWSNKEVRQQLFVGKLQCSTQADFGNKEECMDSKVLQH